MYDYSSTMDTEALEAFLGLGAIGLVAVMFLALFVFVIAMIIMNWFIFAKAGEPGWKALIPYYNSYTLSKFTWGNGWLFLLMLVPGVNIIFSIIWMFRLAKVFGYGFGFGVGLNLVPIIFYPILAFGKCRYVGIPQNMNM